jgi:hypothetical protein
MSSPDPANQLPAFASAETFTDRVVIHEDFVDPEAMCTGEPVHWTGTTRFVVHETSNRGAPPVSDPGAQHFIVNVSLHWTGVGETSGISYRFNSSSQFHFQSPSPVDSFPTVQRSAFYGRVIGPNGFLGFARGTFQSVLNAKDELVFVRDNFTVECR